MGRFAYQAKSMSGKVVKGLIEANDEGEARVKIRAQQMVPLKIVQAGGRAKGAPKSKGMLDSFFEQRPDPKDIQVFTRQFATLINSGIPVVDALEIMGNGLRNGVLRTAVRQTKVSIEQGKRLADAMAMHPNVFDRLYVNMVRAGEEAGILDGILLRLAQYIEKNEKLKSQIKGAMMYPGIILGVAALVISGMLIFIIPKFESLYSNTGGDPPALTAFVVSLSDAFIDKWYVVLFVLIMAPISFVSYYRSDKGKEACDVFFLRVPLFGELIQKSAIARFSRTLSTLLGSAVGVIDALEIAAKTSGNKVVEQTLMKSKEYVMTGKPLASPLANEKIIPDMVVQMIVVGERSGTLDHMLGKVADFYEDEVDNAVKALTSALEPLMMVIIGGIIAFLVIAMYLPVFDMANVAVGS